MEFQQSFSCVNMASRFRQRRIEMNKKELIERRVFLKRQLIKITVQEIKELQARLNTRSIKNDRCSMDQINNINV